MQVLERYSHRPFETLIEPSDDATIQQEMLIYML
jgi:hypothetical protein